MTLDFKQFKSLVKQIKVGKQLPNSVYSHKSALSSYPVTLSTILRNVAKALKIPDNSWNLIKLYKRDFKIAFLHYPEFDNYAYPSLYQSITVDLQKLSHRKSDYSKSENPPILHRKETFVSSDYPHYELFKAITLEGESAGLFEKPKTIGFKKNWERLIKNKNMYLDEKGRLHPQSFSPHSFLPLPSGKVDRHKTAIIRHQLSAPMQILARHGYLRGEHTVLDYGCGKGDDIRELEAHEIDCIGWDPVYQPDNDLENCDIVNLGFVLNVIEDREERNRTLERAYGYADNFLVASVMIAGDATISQFKPYKDGVITSRNTFQKYYSQAEFKYYLESTLKEDVIAVGQGVFILFKDKIEEQNFLLKRQHIKRDWNQLTQREQKKPNKVISKDLIEKNQDLFNDFWTLCLDLGRLPAIPEFEFSQQLRRVAGSHKKALDALLDKHGVETFKKAKYVRKCDLLVYFALGLFGKRKPYVHMPESLKRDIKAFFNDYNNAIELAGEALFSVGNPSLIEALSIDAYEELKHGEFEKGHHWTVHKSVLEKLPPELRIYVGCAVQHYGDFSEMDLVKIHFTSGKVTLLRYDDWSKEEPLLVERIKVKLKCVIHRHRFNYTDVYEQRNSPKINLG
ncbi:DNA phosphorothioation-associated putative methyltransferase [Aliikangiella sp. IMCC44359]|uniref:DNA phosphorothioation-associated putative methyltransferase n=1 Tax=Aliikangiella sp. IMCC44359 TaxID=3459125 RepID=UPI00403AC414